MATMHVCDDCDVILIYCDIAYTPFFYYMPYLG